MSDFRTELYERYVSTFKGRDDPTTSGDAHSEVAASAYIRWWTHKYLPLLEGVAKNAPILELGCGPGDILEALRQHGFRTVEGIDLSPEQIRIATDRGLKARVADVFESLESAPQRYRVIFAVDFMEHFSKDELMRLVPAIRNALEPGGFLIAQTPNGEGLFSNQVVYGDLTHLTIFSPDSMKQLLRLWGFDDFRFVETGPTPDDFKGTLRGFAWRLITCFANLMRMIETGKTQAIWTENMICRGTKVG